MSDSPFSRASASSTSPPGTGDVAVRAARPARRSRRSTSPSRCSKRRASGRREAGVADRFELGDAEYLPYDDAGVRVVASNFGLIFAPDHANVAAELARVVRPGGRIGFTAWKPNPKLAELYRRFTEVPIEGREIYEWGREDHVEDMLGEDFELEFEDGTLWLEARSGEEIWELFSQSAPPVIALLGELDERQAEEFHRAFVELYESYRSRRRRPRAAPLPARARPPQVSDVSRRSCRG